MDANGLRFWLLADGSHFPSRSRAAWDRKCRVLRLASERKLDAPADPLQAFADANSALERVPRSRDAHGSLARWVEQADADGNVGAVMVASPHLPDEVVLMRLAQRPTDLATGHDGVLYVVLADRVLLHDLRGRWADAAVRMADFTPWRIAIDPAGGAWLLERASARLARLDGLPLPERPHADYAHTTFRPSPENPRPPELRVLEKVTWPAGEQPVALAAHPGQGLALLSWVGNGQAQLRRLDPSTEMLGAPVRLPAAPCAYALAWLDDERIAVRMPGRRDAPAFAVEAGEANNARAPLGEIYPLASDAIEAPFIHSLNDPPHYPTNTASEPLYRLSIANLARHGEAATFGEKGMFLVDSGSQVTVWHRLCVEASIPVGAGFIVWLTVTATPEPPAADATWCAHRFGNNIPRAADLQEPQAAWEAWPSELPAHPGLGPWKSERDRSGLFAVLIQNPRPRVRTVTGRYLWVRVEMFGDGRVTPEIAALRFWGSRFSYRDHYLPRLYRETLHGAPALAPGEKLGLLGDDIAEKLDAGGAPEQSLADKLLGAGLQLGRSAAITVEQPKQAWLLEDAGRIWRLRREQKSEQEPEEKSIVLYRPAATAADFLDRFLASFEALLTPLEDRVAAAHLLTEPASAPEEHLDWLGAWIGVTFDRALPAQRRRAWLAAAPTLARYHGTQRGLALALDVATGGGVAGGKIMLIENFRLRRLLATLLGVDLADENDPLLPGLTVSGNSIVGDTLILGEAERAELLALFRQEVATAAENAAVRAFYDQLANRATVLVHQNVSPQDLGLIRRVVELEAPAHVEVNVLTATWPLLVGVASLVGVDTYLAPAPRPQPARADVSALGLGDYVLGPTSLDPRNSGAAAPPLPTVPPVADAGPDFTAAFGHSFNLDASSSRAAPGRTIESYRWRRLPP
jgi:phage tail-like protein